MRINGTVKWFKNEVGYGFVTSAGKDYFVHFSNINGQGYKALNKDDKVEFTIGQGPKGPTATDVTVKK